MRRAYNHELLIAACGSAYSADYFPALRRDGERWARDGARCPIWLSSASSSHAEILATLDRREFGPTCVAAALCLVPPSHADPSGVWAVRADRGPRGIRWSVAWVGPTWLALAA